MTQSKAKNPIKITDIFTSVSLFAIIITTSIITISVSYLKYVDFSNTVDKIEIEYTESQKKILIYQNQ